MPRGVSALSTIYNLFQKSMANGDTKLASLVLDAPNAKKVKELSKQLRCAPDWDKGTYAKDLMHEITVNKFTQVDVCNKAMHNAYLNGVKLVEAVPKGQYSIWGTGLSKSATENTKPEGWTGDDQLGKIMTTVMHELFDEWDSVPLRSKSESFTPPGLPPADMDINTNTQDNTNDHTGYNADNDSEGVLAKI